MFDTVTSKDLQDIVSKFWEEDVIYILEYPKDERPTR
jgi:hypothetical protein